MNDSYFEKFKLGASIPKHVETNTHYLTIGGSYSYGTNMELSDIDVTGFSIPPKDFIFPKAIFGFDNIPSFEEWQLHHVQYKDREYDFKVFSIVKFIKLLQGGNPNIIDTLYTDRDCILYSTPIGEMVREKRSIFLSKLCVPKFRGYAYAELKNVHNKKSGQRKELVEKYGADVKNMCHVVRLLLECEQILLDGHLDLRRDRELLKNIREGKWSLQQVQEFFNSKEQYLLELEHKSKIPERPDDVAIRQLLLDCLEHHYGSLDKYVDNTDKYSIAIREIQNIVGGL